MEDSLFSFEGCDGNVEQMEYFNVTLNKDVGEFKAGHNFDGASIDFIKSQLSLYTGDVLKGRYKLELRVTQDLLNDNNG